MNELAHATQHRPHRAPIHQPRRHTPEARIPNETSSRRLRGSTRGERSPSRNQRLDRGNPTDDGDGERATRRPGLGKRVRNLRLTYRATPALARHRRNIRRCTHKINKTPSHNTSTPRHPCRPPRPGRNTRGRGRKVCGIAPMASFSAPDHDDHTRRWAHRGLPRPVLRVGQSCVICGNGLPGEAEGGC